MGNMMFSIGQGDLKVCYLPSFWPLPKSLRDRLLNLKLILCKIFSLRTLLSKTTLSLFQEVRYRNEEQCPAWLWHRILNISRSFTGRPFFIYDLRRPDNCIDRRSFFQKCFYHLDLEPSCHGQYQLSCALFPDDINERVFSADLVYRFKKSGVIFFGSWHDSDSHRRACYVYLILICE